MSDRGASRTPAAGLAAAPLRAVTFDVNGTLLHAPRLAEIYREVLLRHGVPAAVEDLRRLLPLVWQELACQAHPARDRFAVEARGARGFWLRYLRRLHEHLGAGEPSRFVAAELYDRFASATAWEVFPDVRPTLTALRRRGVRLAVVSNWDERLPQLLTRLELSSFFETIVYSQAVGVEKPHPEIFRAALERLGIPPEEALHVGDRRREDAEGALGAGMRALLLEREHGGGLGALTAELLGRPARRGAKRGGAR